MARVTVTQCPTLTGLWWLTHILQDGQCNRWPQGCADGPWPQGCADGPMAVQMAPWLCRWPQGCADGPMVVQMAPRLCRWPHGCADGPWPQGCADGPMVVQMAPWLCRWPYGFMYKVTCCPSYYQDSILLVLPISLLCGNNNKMFIKHKPLMLK